MTPDGASPPIFERTIMDEFQDKMEAIPATKRETGVAPEDRFENELFPIEDMKTYLSQMNISIRHGYPREEKDLPGIFINLGAEDENTYLGDVQHVIQNDSPPEQNIIFGVDVSTSYYLNILSSNYDETIFLYYLVRYALIRYRRVLEVYGMRTPKIHFNDVEPSNQLFSSGLFIYQRTGIISCDRTDSFPVKVEAFEKALMNIPFTDQIPEKEVVPGLAEPGPGDGLP